MLEKWEYLIIIATLKGMVVTVDDLEVRNKKIKYQLDTLGGDGWECFQTMVLPAEADSDHNQRIQYSLKRRC